MARPQYNRANRRSGARRRRPAPRARRCRSQHVRFNRSSRKGRRNSSRGLRRFHSVFNIPLVVPRNLQDVKFDLYIKRVQKKVKPNLALKRESVKLLDNLLRDTLHQVAFHASSNMGRRKVLKPKIILKALRKFMPRSLVRRVDEHAQGVLDRYCRNTKGKRPKYGKR